MFSNLAQGSIIYGLDTRDKIKLFTAQINSISLPHAKNISSSYFGQVPEMVVDIVATVNGERREFRQVPSNNTIANFGDNAFILADTRESLLSYVNSMLQTSKNIISSVDKHKELITQYESVLGEINPNLQVTAANNSAVKELQSEVEGLKSQLAEAIALLKGGNNK